MGRWNYFSGTSIFALCVVLAALTSCGEDAQRERPLVVDSPTAAETPADTSTGSAEPPGQSDRAPEVAGVRMTARIERPPESCELNARSCRRTVGTGLDDSAGYGRALVFFDVDLDGDDDVWVGSADGVAPSSSALYVNDGEGRYTPDNRGIDSAAMIGSWGATAADVDDDGDPDLLLANGGYQSDDGRLVLLRNDHEAGGGFTDMTESSGLPQEPAAWWAVTAGDVDLDGNTDVVATRTRTGPPVLYLGRGDGTFEDASESSGMTAAIAGHPALRQSPEGLSRADWKNPVLFDLDSDGDDDIFIGGAELHVLLENDGTGRFSLAIDRLDSTHPALRMAGRSTTFASAAADFDQNGTEDLYLGRWDEIDLVVLQSPDGELNALGPRISGLDHPPEINTMGLGVSPQYAFDIPKVVIGSGEPHRAHDDAQYCAGPGRPLFVDCSNDLTHGISRGHGAAFSDVDRDGDLDALWNLGGFAAFDLDPANASGDVDTTERNALYLTSGSDPTVARVRLRGTASNPDGFGARISFDDAGSSRHHVVRGAQGFQSQNTSELLVPVAGTTAEVVVRWQGSGRAERFVVTPGQSVTLVEGEGTAI